MTQILVTVPVEDRHIEKLREACPNGTFTFSAPKDVTPELVRSAEVILGNVPAAMIRGSEKLGFLQLNSAGTDGYTAPGVLPDGALLANATGAYGLAISEHMLGMLLCLMKKLNLYQHEQDNCSWTDHGSVNSIEGSRTLVVGCGDIGSSFARKMNALGSTVTGIRRTVQPKPDFLEAQYLPDMLDACLPEADIVALTLPGTSQTRHLFDADRLAKMKPGAILLNVGRGTAVDSEALADALNSGRLFGAGIDVTDPEPLPADHPLWKAGNILITPHISGNYHLQETLERIIRIATENLRRYSAGEPILNQVDFATGYRKTE